MRLASSTHPRLIGFKKPPMASPLQTEYWSQTPYKFGELGVKYRVIPSEANGEPKLSPAKDVSNSLREAMVQRLTDQKLPASFDFCIQEQSDVKAMPIEDPTVEWKSEPIKLATITIEPQVFDSEEQNQIGENLSFSPWNSLPEHRPLGGINRARKAIYEASHELRNRTNDAKP